MCLFPHGSFLLTVSFVALAGAVISPSRGRFVFVPAAGFVLYRVAR